MAEIGFNKYEKMGPYHWDQISLNPRKRSAFVVDRYRKILDLIDTAFGDSDPAQLSVIDIGAGDGVLVYLLAKQGYTVSGVEPDTAAVEWARQRLSKWSNVSVSCGSGYAVDASSASYDVVVSTEVIEHVAEPDRLLAEAARLVKPGGVTIVTTPVRFTEEPLDDQHVREWFPSEFKEMLCRHWSEVDVVYSHPVAKSEVMNSLWFGRRIPRFFFAILSMIDRPFLRNSDSYRYKMLQYGICKNS